MSSFEDEVTTLVLDTFQSLPAKRKPRPAREDSSKEWVPLAGIVLSQGNQLTCASLATGMKCLPQSKLHQARGFVLHDWHAEILAIRSFNRFLIQECHHLATSPSASSAFVRWRDERERSELRNQPFTIKEDTQIHMYCSEAPCGDASMELTMAAQQDSTPWAVPTPLDTGLPSSEAAEVVLHGRGYFSELGAVRRKPDAPLTMSKSCSDKLALKQCTSLLSSMTSLLISPDNAYIQSLILPSSQYSAAACGRAFGTTGRMKPLVGKKWDGGYGFRPFSVKPTSQEFSFSRRSTTTAEKVVPSNTSLVWTPQLQESLIGGVLQGRKQFDPRGASQICRRGMWRAVVDVLSLCGAVGLERVTSGVQYFCVKEGLDSLEARREVKRDVTAEALKGWVRNGGDDEFELNDS